MEAYTKLTGQSAIIVLTHVLNFASRWSYFAVAFSNCGAVFAYFLKHYKNVQMCKMWEV